MRSEREIRQAIFGVNKNKELTYAYRFDVSSILNWVLDGEPFDGLPEIPPSVSFEKYETNIPKQNESLLPGSVIRELYEKWKQEVEGNNSAEAFINWMLRLNK